MIQYPAVSLLEPILRRAFNIPPIDKSGERKTITSGLTNLDAMDKESCLVLISMDLVILIAGEYTIKKAAPKGRLFYRLYFLWPVTTIMTSETILTGQLTTTAYWHLLIVRFW